MASGSPRHSRGASQPCGAKPDVQPKCLGLLRDFRGPFLEFLPAIRRIFLLGTISHRIYGLYAGTESRPKLQNEPHSRLLLSLQCTVPCKVPSCRGSCSGSCPCTLERAPSRLRVASVYTTYTTLEWDGSPILGPSIGAACGCSAVKAVTLRRFVTPEVYPRVYMCIPIREFFLGRCAKVLAFCWLS